MTPFGPWSYDFTEEQAAELLAGCPRGCVLVSHSPPKGTVDVDSRGRSLGSVAVRDAACSTTLSRREALSPFEDVVVGDVVFAELPQPASARPVPVTPTATARAALLILLRRR